MTPSKMLENPALAHEWAQALRSSQPDELARMKAMIGEIRAAHGCRGEVAMPAPGAARLGAAARPSAHPSGAAAPVRAPAIPSGVPLFEAPAVFTI